MALRKAVCDKIYALNLPLPMTASIYTKFLEHIDNYDGSKLKNLLDELKENQAEYEEENDTGALDKLCEEFIECLREAQIIDDVSSSELEPIKHFFYCAFQALAKDKEVFSGENGRPDETIPLS